MKRRRARPQPPLQDRDLAAEVLYLHSLWRRGPSATAPVPVPAAASAAAPNQSRTTRSGPVKSKRRRLGRGAAGDPEDAGPESPHAPAPPASASAPSSGSPARPAAPEAAVSNRGPSSSARRKANKRKRRGLESDAAAETQDAGSEKPLAPSSPAALKTWPEGPTSPSPLKPTPAPPSPGSLAHREALRAAEEFFANQGSDGDDEEEMSESEGDEEEAAEFFTGLFERDTVLRGHYEQGWEKEQFSCMACAGKKARRGKARRFRGCVSLVQHARAATRYGRPGAHRALTAVVCRVLGWDIQRLPSIVLDPRGTLSQALAATAQANALEVKEDVRSEMNGSNTNGDEAANELPTSKESAGMKDVEEIASLNHEDSSANETNQENDVVKTGIEEPLNIDGEKEITELSGSKESFEKKDVEEVLLNRKDSSRKDVYGHETNQEKDVVNTKMEEAVNIDGEKEITELNGGKESFKKDNANKDGSLSQDNNGVVHEQDIAVESTEKEINATASEPEHDKTADDIGDTGVTTLGNSPREENVDECKEHASSTN